MNLEQRSVRASTPPNSVHHTNALKNNTAITVLHRATAQYNEHRPARIALRAMRVTPSVLHDTKKPGTSASMADYPEQLVAGHFPMANYAV
jgi:hypothetical protein